MRRAASLAVLVVTMLICSSTALAVDYYSWSGGDWGTLSTWAYLSGSWQNATVLPGTADTCDISNSSAGAKITVAVSTTASIDRLTMGSGGTTDTDSLVIYGTLDLNNAGGANYNGLTYGHSSWPTTLAHSLTEVKSGAVFDVGKIEVLNTNASSVNKIQQTGGTVSVTNITLNTSQFNYQLQDGTLTITGSVTGTNMILNISGGTLTMNSSVFTVLVSNGTIIQANGIAVNSGNVYSLFNVDGTTSPGNVIVTLRDPRYAYTPSPIDGGVSIAVTNNLNWLAGENAVSHDVYFGTSESDVANAQRLAGDINGDGSVDIEDIAVLGSQWLTNPGAVNPSADVKLSGMVDFDDFAVVTADWGLSAELEFMGNQAGTTFDPGTLDEGTTYYWRIDEVNPTQTDSPWKGPVWSFTTLSPRLTPEQFPIIPWSAPWRNWGPTFSTSVLSEVRDCGFNIGGFLQPSQLDYAAAANIKGIVFYDPYPYGLYCHVYGTGEGASVDMTNLTQTEVNSRVQTMVNWVGSHSALFGYYLRDEPGANLYPVLSKFVTAFHNYDPDHLSLINLFPNYANSTQMQVSTYNTYVSNYMSTVNPDYVCYDHYGITDSLSVTSNYWSNLQTIRSYAMAYGKPFWQIVCSVKRTGWPTPSMATLRFQLYSSLAYGAKGIGYWMYFNWPAPQLINGTWWFTPEHTLAPIDINGNKTATWYYLQAVNMELHTIGQVYITLNNVNYHHYPSMPSGWSVTGSSNILIGEFTQNGTGKSFILVVNKSITSSATVSVTESLPGSVHYVSSSDGNIYPLSGNLTLNPGEGRLLTVQ